MTLNARHNWIKVLKTVWYYFGHKEQGSEERTEKVNNSLKIQNPPKSNLLARISAFLLTQPNFDLINACSY